MKEGLWPSQESRSVAAITFQNLFLMFPKIVGMSGTLADASEELRDVYGVEVLVIPPNRPKQRKDLADIYFRDSASQLQAAVWTALEVRLQPQWLGVGRILSWEKEWKSLEGLLS